ncbi:MAG TPA: thiamine phosphate synthase [Longimicrobiales bacterium]
MTTAPIDALPDFRLIVITDHALARPRTVSDIVRACLEAGAPVIQLRDKHATARELFDQARRLRDLTARFDARLIVNDRLDVALAAHADGVHLGPDDLPIKAARRAAAPPFIIGFSTDDPAEAARAQAEGADYIGCGAVFGTTTKAEVGEERIGPAGLAAVARAVDIPVVGIGGIGPANVAALAGTGAAGIAVIGAIMTADEPAAVTRALLAACHDFARTRDQDR